MLYHYTDLHSARDIQRTGVIRAVETIIYRDLVPQAERSLTLPPLVWLSTNPYLDGTVWAKMQLGGWPTPLGNLCRIVVRPDLCDVGLGDYADLHKIDYDWFIPMVQTGKLSGSDYTAWRLHSADIPATDWRGVEVLASASGSGVVWKMLKGADQ